MKQLLFTLLTLVVCLQASAQPKRSNLIYVDDQGIIRYTKNNSEAAFFGTNYTVPFAYGYRSHKALGVDIEKAIDADVYHMARLGLDAFRVHVWDVEISDSLGNLLANEHLRLFDYLIQKLKEHNIKILITPIAFWGNGYPEPDIKTDGFSYVYTKGGAVVKEEAFKAQENYLKQFFTHVNPYTKLTYRDDPDVIAMEINNEPQHTGPKARVTEYVNRMAVAVRSTGWTKPIFYNISESPTYADAVVKADVDGHSFQWYPTGLVAGHEQKGNLLPNVDQYRIPFLDTIAAFKNRARMVYEFDAGDVMQPVMYPAMARSFRTAGMQWATQFAYDPLHTAYANTEYQTHYLNLAYTPAKAISLLIASKAFHRLPRGKSYGTYPADTLFDVFRVSYKEELSEMNSEEEFYYTGNTTTQPKNIAKLKHIAGVGSSPVVQYEGTGAYFLDKMSDSVWRLEIMADALLVKDPFEKTSTDKAVATFESRLNRMKLSLPDFSISSITSTPNGQSFPIRVDSNAFTVSPGIHCLSRQTPGIFSDLSNVLYPPHFGSRNPQLVHQPYEVVSSGIPFSINAMFTGIEAGDSITVEFEHYPGHPWHTRPTHSATTLMQNTGGLSFKADVPAKTSKPGVLVYRILVNKPDGKAWMFPGNYKGDPTWWNHRGDEHWQTTIAAPRSRLILFDPARTDRDGVVVYNPNWRTNFIEYVTKVPSVVLALKATTNNPSPDSLMGWQFFFGDKIRGRKSELPSFTKLVVRARSTTNAKASVSLITSGAEAYNNILQLEKDWKEYSIPLSSLQPATQLLLPRPYPSFQPLRFKPNISRPFNVSDIEKLEMTFAEAKDGSPISMEVEAVWLER